MDINKTGNTLITYSLEGEDPTIKDFIKEQNIDFKVSPTMGFTLKYNDYTVDMESLVALRTLTADVRARLNAFVANTEDVDVEVVIAEINETLAGDAGKPFEALKASGEPKNSEEPCGLTFLYNLWAEAMKIVPKDTEE
jgi:hypothetical protein